MADDVPSLAPVLLVSMPQMMDPNFSRTVVLLAEYGPHGAFGLVVNRQMSEAAREVVKPDPPLAIQPDLHLFVGGPVETSRAWILMEDNDLDGDALEVSEGVFLSASTELIKRTLSLPPEPGIRIVVGYAGWSAGQLDVELAESAWLMAPVQPDLIFTTPLESMWETAIRRLGAEPSALQGSSGIH